MRSASVSPVVVNWGVSSLERLKNSKVLYFYVMSEEWMAQLVKARPDIPRRVWFDIISFNSSPIVIKSPFLKQSNFSQLDEVGINITYEVSPTISFYEYYLLAEATAQALEQEGYLVVKCIYDMLTIENKTTETPRSGVTILDPSTPTKLHFPQPRKIKSFVDIKAPEPTILDLFPTSMWNFPAWL